MKKRNSTAAAAVSAAAVAGNKATKPSSAGSGGGPSATDERHASYLDEELRSLMRTKLTLVPSMPLVFDSGEYEQTSVYGTIGSRDRPEDKWQYGAFVPAQVVLHAHGTDGETLLSAVFSVRQPDRPGERETIQSYLPRQPEEGVFSSLGGRYVSLTLRPSEEAQSTAERIFLLRFNGPGPRDAFLARACEPEMELAGFGLTKRAGGSGAPLRRPTVKSPAIDDIDAWDALRRVGTLRDVALQELKMFCEAWPAYDTEATPYAECKLRGDWYDIVIFIIVEQCDGC